jgi:acyl-CoA reductase-like NAD-dependent aldehyde dehydrogenase
LVSDPRVDLIVFTGSLEVGLNILRQTATVASGQRNIKRVITEMGGKNAIIVDTDADLDMAVQGVISSSFNYAGQKCSACSRVIVLDAVHDQFVSRLIKAAASLVVGDPSDPAVRVGPVITDEARQRILAYVDTGQAEATLAYPLEGDTVNFRTPPATVDTAALAPPESGLAADMRATPQAHVLTSDQEAPFNPETATDAEPWAADPDVGAEPEQEPSQPGEAEQPTPEQPAPELEPQTDATEAAPTDSATGYFVAPHIFIDTPPDATIAQEEIFGPVLVVMKAHKFKDALQLAGGVKYGLTGGVYSRNPDHIRRAVREFRVGNLYINRPITGAMVGRQPFGGSRMSGVGSKAGGPDYLLQFMEPRTVTENTIRRGFIPEE